MSPDAATAFDLRCPPRDDRIGVPSEMGDVPVAAPSADANLVRVGRWLMQQGYHFICPTPATQERVSTRENSKGEAQSLREVFGWNRPFRATLLPDFVLHSLRLASALDENESLLRARVRFSSLKSCLFVHSAFPTESRDAVFFGPDTYRFVAMLSEILGRGWPHDIRRVVDLGCGSGAGAIAIAELLNPRELQELLLADLNPVALRLAATNAEINNVGTARCVCSDVFDDIPGSFDLITVNPPYIIDRKKRLYRDGGAAFGTELSLQFLREAISRLDVGGRLLLYTGTPIVEGVDPFWIASLPILESAEVKYHYFEIDPDVHGESLELPEYSTVERIAAVGLVVHRPGGRR